MSKLGTILLAGAALGAASVVQAANVPVAVCGCLGYPESSYGTVDDPMFTLTLDCAGDQKLDAKAPKRTLTFRPSKGKADVTTAYAEGQGRWLTTYRRQANGLGTVGGPAYRNLSLDFRCRAGDRGDVIEPVTVGMAATRAAAPYLCIQGEATANPCRSAASGTATLVKLNAKQGVTGEAKKFLEARKRESR
jgi:hypothetical protein